MPGEAILTIRDKQWQVSVADTPWELAQGLGGLPELSLGTGILFDTGLSQIIQVTTEPMLFPVDIAFLSETAVVTEVYRNVEPGYIVTSTLPARYFLEVNAGELEGIGSGDRALVEFLPLEEIPVVETDWMSAMVGFMGFAVMAVFVTAIARDFIKAALEPAKEKPVLYGPRGERLPKTKDIWETRAVVLEDTLTGMPGFQDKLPSLEDWLTNVERELFPTLDLVKRTVERFPDRFGITRENVVYVKFAQFPQTKASEKKPTRDDVEVGSWVERDRIGIWVVDLRTDKTIAEWWDEKANEMFDQGFFKPAAWIKGQTLWGKEFRDSVLDYLEDIGVLARTGLQPQTKQELVRVTRPADSWFRQGQIVTREEFEKAVVWVKERGGQLPLGEPLKGEPADLAARILQGLQGTGEAYKAYVKYPSDKSAFVVVGSIIGGHYSWNPQGFSVWVSSWKADPEWPRDSILRIREMKPARAYEATEEGVKRALDYVKSEFPTFTESTWVSKSIPVYVAQELGILQAHLPQTSLTLLPQTTGLRQDEEEGEFLMDIDRVGNILVTHSQRPVDIFLQLEADKELVYDLLRKDEREDLDRGWTVKIKDTEPRASILEDLWSNEVESQAAQWLTKEEILKTAGEAAAKKGYATYDDFAVAIARKRKRRDGREPLLPGVRVMPKLPPEAYKDLMFCEYVHDLVRLGEEITDEEAGLMWEAWQKRQPQQLPSVAPREGEYSWLITDPETGEMMIKPGYATVSKAQRAARDFALRRARYAGEHAVKLRIYDRDPDIGDLETGVVFRGQVRLPEGRVVEEEMLEPQAVPRFKPGEIVKYKGERVRVSEQIGDRVNIFVPSRQELVWVKPRSLERIEGKQAAVIPTEPRRPQPGKEEMEFLPDSPEVLAQTIDAIGYREKIDTAFLEAIKRAKSLR